MNSTLDPRNFAYITLLSSENYLDAVLVLHESLKDVGSQYPLVCAVTKNCNSTKLITRLMSENIRIEWIDNLIYSDTVRKKYDGKAVLNTASKISLFSLVNYDKLCYIDADTMVVKNIDDVFDRLDGSMVKMPDDDYGFTGLFVFSPRNHRADFYLHLLQNFDCFDGDLIGSLWFHTRTSSEHHIDQNYCRHYNDDFSKKERRQVKVWHFCNEGNKPWIAEDRAKMNNECTVIQKYDEYMRRVHQNDI